MDIRQTVSSITAPSAADLAQTINKNAVAMNLRVVAVSCYSTSYMGGTATHNAIVVMEPWPPVNVEPPPSC